MGSWLRLESKCAEVGWTAELRADYFAAWIKLLCLVKAWGEQGIISRGYFTPRKLKSLGIKVVVFDEMLSIAQRNGAIERQGNDGDDIILCGWSTYQIDPTSTERQKDYRSRHVTVTNSDKRDVTRINGDKRDVTHVTMTGQDTTIQDTTIQDDSRARARGLSVPESDHLQVLVYWWKLKKGCDVTKYQRESIDAALQAGVTVEQAKPVIDIVSAGIEPWCLKNRLLDAGGVKGERGDGRTGKSGAGVDRTFDSAKDPEQIGKFDGL